MGGEKSHMICSEIYNYCRENLQNTNADGAANKATQPSRTLQN